MKKNSAETHKLNNMAVEIFVYWFDMKVFFVNLCDTEEQLKSITVLQLKQKISEIKGCRPDDLTLIFRDRPLNDSALLCDCRVVNMSLVFAERKPRGGGEWPVSETHKLNNMAVGVFVEFEGDKFFVKLCDTEEQLKSITVLQLKQKIIEIKNDSEIKDGLRLIFGGRQLEDSALLFDCGVVNMPMVSALRRLLGGGLPVSGKGDDSMGDKDKNRSMEKLSFF